MKFCHGLIGADPLDWGRLAVACERAGFDSVAVSDHVVYPSYLRSKYPYTPDGTPLFSPEEDWPDAWVAIASMAAVTTTLRFLTNVYVLPARNPFVAAKAIGTAAHLSRGRVGLGVGAGWMREEFELRRKILRFTGDVWKDHACCVVLMHEQDLQERPEWTQKVVNALVQAQAWIQDNREQTARILSKDNAQALCLVFVNTKRMADALCGELQRQNLRADALHGDIQQQKRERIMNAFRAGRLDVLVATDVAARGIDVRNIDLVVNYDLPLDSDCYVHRIGRTGRAERLGTAHTLIYRQETGKLNAIMRDTRAPIQRAQAPAAV